MIFYNSIKMNKENLRTTFNQSILQLLYEFFGSFLMSVLFINYGKYNNMNY